MKSPPHPTPTISRVLADGTLIDLVYRADAEATSFAICRSDGEIRVDPEYELPDGERLVPYSAANNLIASGCVLLPSDLEPLAAKAALLEDMRTFLRRYVDLKPAYEDIAAHYVLLSWVYDAFNEVPYLRFQGAFGSGKTRALLVVGSLCYKPFFASGASTVSPIFHVLDTVSGTLVLDEADLRFSDATADLTKILNNGSTKGLPVLRTMTNRHRELNPKAFKVFGPKIVAMREGFADEALESRFITLQTGRRALRQNIPISLPDTMQEEALILRNRLLGWRFAMRHQVAIDPKRAMPTLSARGNQMALPLLAIVDDENLRCLIGEELRGWEEEMAAAREAAPEARLKRIIADMAQTATTSYLSLAAITGAYNENQIGSSTPPLSIKAIGGIIRRNLGLRTTKSRGVFVIPADQWDKISRLAKRYDADDQPERPSVGA